MIKITSRLLKSKRACAEQVALFKELGGDTKLLTKELFLTHVSKFNIQWAVNNLLTSAQRAEYKRVSGPAVAEYERVRGLAYAEYERVSGPAVAEYKRVRGLAWAEYERVSGLALWNALNLEENVQ
jgi:hypothetical protein